MTKPDLDRTYRLASSDDTKQLYADWAQTYDSGFAADMEFLLPGHVAGAFAKTGAQGPVLDFGAGTGLLGEALQRHGIAPVDALDLSPQMLAVAARKGVYRDLFEGNLLDGFSLNQRYAGLVSSGTFTNGHVGPEALPALLDLGVSGTQYALSINGRHYVNAGFARAFERLMDQIDFVTLKKVAFYGPKATGPHKDDTGYVALFRKR